MQSVSFAFFFNLAFDSFSSSLIATRCRRTLRFEAWKIVVGAAGARDFFFFIIILVLVTQTFIYIDCNIFVYPYSMVFHRRKTGWWLTIYIWWKVTRRLYHWASVGVEFDQAVLKSDIFEVWRLICVYSGVRTALLTVQHRHHSRRFLVIERLIAGPAILNI